MTRYKKCDSSALAEGKFARRLTQAFQVLFAVSFLFIILNVLFNREVYGYFAPILIVLSALSVALLFLLYSRLRKHRTAVEKHFYKILLGMVLGLFLIQMLFAHALEYDPVFDLEAVYRGAQHWVETGSFADYVSDTCHTGYFYIFPNNLGGLCFLYLLFRVASWFGITNYFMVAAVCNALLLCGTVALSACVAKRLWSPESGLLCAALFLLSPPFWFLADVFYTDSLSMIFPVAVWYAVLRAQSGNRTWKTVVWYLVAGITGAVGGLLKPTVWIVWIAISIVQLLRRLWMKQLLFTVAVAVSMLAVQLIFHAAIYPSHLNPATAQRHNLPYEYWLSIALSQNGEYRQDYFERALAPAGKSAKKEALREVIRSDLQSQKLSGLLKLFTVKETRAFGDGTYASSDFLDDRPSNRNILHEFLLYDGEYYSVYAHVATGVFVAALALMVLSVIRRTYNLPDMVAPLCLFGLMLLFLVWEVSGRYMVNFIPMIFLSATSGIAYRYPKRPTRVRREQPFRQF